MSVQGREVDLFALLAAADPVPPAVDEAARMAIGHRLDGTRLAELAAETVTEPTGQPPARGRHMHFEVDDLTIDVDVTMSRDTCRLQAQVDPDIDARAWLVTLPLRVEAPMFRGSIGPLTFARAPFALSLELLNGSGPRRVQTQWTVA